ncbi:E3 ubiquitin-protein ligase mgrn1 [Plakobranchus ocellatus]|uniref:RING-type E3 ubiquitin transferase n=1 Tax=Plakobranchus ocellatus TaxID=259542 RepID=A0AAV3YVJ8_9GAST|nr:E3 ubiquitin-protein ligase mgrn1 [Plakobranchus ocellatus]
MGAALTRNRNGHEETTDLSTQSAYRFPPKAGSYFGTHFIMGGERFESPQPGEYLFGDSDELNFLGNKPVPFPYPVPSGNEPTKTLKSLVYIRKDSIRLVKAPGADKVTVDGSVEGCLSTQYNVEFIFDSDVKCAIRVHYFCAEEVVNGQVVYHPRDPTMSSEIFHYKRGAGQSFSQPTHTVDPSKFSDEEWQYNFDKELYPIAIHCVVEEEEHSGHAHITYAVIEKSQEGSYTIKPLKQKQVVDGLCYLLQEIYGIENKNMERLKDIDPDDEVEDSGAECVICMSDMRDTLILPCRHLCLCSSCADSLRYQASMCPICRVKFRALLQIRAMRKKVAPVSSNTPQSDSDDNPVNQEGVPPGYEAISLIEALNGQVVPPLSGEGVHLQISGPPAVFTVEKKGQKETKVTVTGPIEYQKEMDTDKESSKGTLEKQKDKDKKQVLDTTDVTSTDAVSDATPEESVPRSEFIERSRSPPKATVVTVRCSPDGKMITETKISPMRETDLAPAPVSNRRHPERDYKATPNLGRMACGLSTGDMADDEREDSSEPEADYDDRDSDPGTTTTSHKSSNQSLYQDAPAALMAVDVESSACNERDIKEKSPLSDKAFAGSKPISQRQNKGKGEVADGAAGVAFKQPDELSAPAHHQLESEISSTPTMKTSPPHSRLSSQPHHQQHQQHVSYDPLQVASLSDVYSLHSSGTEGSSFGSNCSANALLPQEEGLRSESNAEGEEDDDDNQTMGNSDRRNPAV